ncbi:MAG: Autotransporter-associated beta strand repeat protein [Verrucomicrobiales bacterium]|nr:Autotransporter-associated beta strand repeat protein [Verrucomicrobiales bacterium]
MNSIANPSTNGANRPVHVLFPAAVLSFFAGAYSVSAQPDYAPAIYRPMTGCSKWHTTGNGHKFAIIHDMEGYYASTISYLNTCSVSVSIHYMVNGRQDATSDYVGGEITQSVPESKYAFHALCWNDWSFGTEHEGFAANPAWYTPAMYIATAGLQRHLCDVWSIPKDRNHVVGHGEGGTSAWVTYVNANYAMDPSCNNHTDPGACWNWTYLMDLITKTNVVTGKYWDVNGMTAGSGSTPTGTWNNSSTNWSSNANGTVQTGVWGGIDDAIFSAGTDGTNAYTVTVSGTQSVYSLRVERADVTFTGGKLVFTGFGSYYSNYVAAGHTATFNTSIGIKGGPDKWGAGTAIYNSANTPPGYFTLNQGTIAVGHNSALGTNKFVIGDPTGANVVVFKAASATARTLGNDLSINALNFTLDSVGDLTFNGDVDLGTTTKTVTVNNNSTFAGAITDTGGITKLGPGTMVFSSTNINTYGGTTTISAGTLKLQKTPTSNAIPAAVTVNTGGTLLLAASDQIANAAAMTLAGGVFSTAGFDEQLGTCKLTANSQIDLGTNGSILKFANSSAIPWTAATTLTVSNWNGSIFGAGTEQLFFGTTGAGLSAAQMNQIKFVNPAGFGAGTYAAKILSTGEVVPNAVAPLITTQPQSQTVLVSSNVNFFVVASGTSNLVYQWRFGATNLAGATTSQLSLTNVTLNQAGSYSVVVTNVAGSATSSNAILSVYASASATMSSGSNTNGNFTLSVVGVPSYSYVIEVSTNLVNWNAVRTNVSPFTFTNGNAAIDPTQFYRAVYVP